MIRAATRYLYLVRHAEALPDGSGLTENGRRQAVLLGQRLQDVPFSTAHHGPLPRAVQTARLALRRFTGPVDGGEEQHQLVVTHNFLVAWLVRHAMDAPRWRWLSLTHSNAALTVLRFTPGRPASVLFYNDMRHLTAELRWTGFPADLRWPAWRG